MATAAHLRRLRDGIRGPLTLGALAGRLGREGVGLLVVLLSAPFLQPLPTGGLSLPAGLMIAAAGLQTARGEKGLRLPRFASERRIEEPALRRLLGLAEAVLSRLEKATRPRGPEAARSPRLLGAAVAALGLALAVPIYIPFAAMACAAPLVLLGLALAEEDGVFGAAGLLAGVLALAYHVAAARLAWAAAARLARRFA
jgi:hypothetical protein